MLAIIIFYITPDGYLFELAPCLLAYYVNISPNTVQVAVKKMKRKFFQWEECISLREVKVIYLMCYQMNTNLFSNLCA